MRRVHQVLVSHLVGGAGIVAIRLAASATKHGFQCTAWVPGPGPATEALIAERVAWRRYNLDAMRDGRVRHALACGRIFTGLVAGTRPIVHVHNPLIYRFMWPALAASRARVVVHFQIEPSTEEIDWALKFPPDHVIACAGYIANQIEERLPAVRRKPKVSSIPNSIDVDRFTPGSRHAARVEVGLSTDRFVVLMMANLAEHKGQATALRATHRLLNRGVPVECWLAGEDRVAGQKYEEELRQMTAQLGIEPYVRFLGFRKDGVNLLRAADVLLLPSKHEGLPLTILEAQATELPVIASGLPGIREVIKDGQNGLIVEADDVDGYADAIERLYSNGAHRRALGLSARQSVCAQYSWAELERRTYEIYESLLGA